MYELKRAMTNRNGETKWAGELVNSDWLGANAHELEQMGWVKPVKRKVEKLTKTETKEADNG